MGPYCPLNSEIRGTVAVGVILLIPSPGPPRCRLGAILGLAGGKHTPSTAFWAVQPEIQKNAFKNGPKLGLTGDRMCKFVYR